MGNAERLLDHYGDRIRWVTDGRGHWMTYTDGLWSATHAETLVAAFALDTVRVLRKTEAKQYSTAPLRGPDGKPLRVRLE